MNQAKSSVLRSQPVADQLNEFGYVVFESRHNESFSMAQTVHRFPKVLWIREGGGRIDGDWGKQDCNSGDCVIIPAGMKHHIVDDRTRPISLYGMGLSPRHFASVPDSLGRLRGGVHLGQRLLPLAIESRLRRMLFLDGRPHPGSHLACIAAAIELFAELILAFAGGDHRSTKDEPADSHWVDPAIAVYVSWLDHHFFEPVTLQDAAKACQMSRRHFTDCFKAYTGTTWLTHLHQLRVRHAIELLRSTDRKITSVAFQCGFDDVTTFYRVVNKLTGKRPGEHRTG